MKKELLKLFTLKGLVILCLFICCKKEQLTFPIAVPPVEPKLATPSVAIYAGGPVYYTRSTAISELKASGFTEVVVWNIFVNNNGDLNFNGEFPLVSNGVYTGGSKYPNFAGDITSLKQGITSVTRVTFCIGSSVKGIFQAIRDLVNTQGTSYGSILYRNFQALKGAIPSLDAIDLDDENCYDSATMIKFCVMLGNLGYKVTLCPYSNAVFWTGVASQVNLQKSGTVDMVHLQCYAGGWGNNPCSGWNFGAIPVLPGLWDTGKTPAQVQVQMADWKSSCGISGGFMWLYDDFVGMGKAAQYASAIKNGVAL